MSRSQPGRIPLEELAAREVRDELSRIGDRVVRACRDAAALTELAEHARERVRATRAVTARHRTQWHAWHTGFGAACLHSSTRNERCVVVMCHSCDAVTFAAAPRAAPLAGVHTDPKAQWFRPPDVVQRQLRTASGGMGVAFGHCPGCLAHSDGDAPTGEATSASCRDLADRLLSVLAHIADEAAEIAAREPALDESAALARALEDVIARLGATLLPEELPQFAEALDALLARLQASVPRRVRGDAAPHFRPALRRR